MSALESLKKIDALIAATIERIEREANDPSPKDLQALCEALRALTDARKSLKG